MLFKLNSIIRTSDIFAQGVGFNVAGQEKFKTKTGAIFSMIYILGFVAIGVIQFDQYFDLTSPQSTLESYQTNVYPAVDIGSRGLVPFFLTGPNDFDYSLPKDVSYFVTFSAYRLSAATDPVTFEINYLKKQIPVVGCSELNEDELSAYSYLDRGSPMFKLFLKYGLCLKISSELTVQGKGSDMLREYFLLFIYPCSNSSPSQCATASELDDFEFQMVTPMANYNSSNYDNPFNLKADADALYFITPKIKQRFDVSIIKNDIFHFEGLYPNWRNFTTFYELNQKSAPPKNRNEKNIHCKKEQIFTYESSDCISYFEMAIKSSGKVQIRKRAYQTLMDTIGTIGGITGIVSMAFQFIYNFINESKRNNFILKKVYPLIVAEEHFSTKMIRRKFPFCCFKRRVNLSVLGDKGEQENNRVSRVGISRERALERINESLDVLTIVKNASLLSILVELFFKDRHKGLSQLVDLKLWYSSHERKKNYLRQKENSLERRKYAKRPHKFRSNSSKRFSDALNQRSKWIEDLEWHHSESQRVNNRNTVENHVARTLDELYYENIMVSESHKQTNANTEKKIRIQNTYQPVAEEQKADTKIAIPSSLSIAYEINKSVIEKRDHRLTVEDAFPSPLLTSSAKGVMQAGLVETNPRLRSTSVQDSSLQKLHSKLFSKFTSGI